MTGMSRSVERSSVAALAAIGVLALSGVAGARHRDDLVPRRHVVEMQGMAFHPQVLEVQQGDTVVWVNRDFYPHTATDTEGRFDSGVIPAGQSWTLTVEASGELRYICTFHPTMRATLRVC